MTELTPVEESALGKIPDQPVGAIRWHEEAADLLAERSDAHRFEAARIMHDEIVVRGRETQRSMAEKTGKSHVHVGRCIEVHKIIVGNPGYQDGSWNELYQQVKSRPPEITTRSRPPTPPDPTPDPEPAP
jgi:hypothetical protein